MTSRNQRIRINESADGGVVVSALQVIEPGLFVEVVAAVAEGVQGCKATGLSEDVTPGVVGIGCDEGFVADLVDFQHVALQVLDEVVVRPGCTVGIPQRDADRRITFVQNITHIQRYCIVCVIPGFTYIDTVYDLIENVAAVTVNLLGSKTLVVVLVSGCLVVVGNTCQFPAFRPAHGVMVAVIVLGGVAAVVVSDTLPVYLRQQILPAVGIVIGVGMAVGAVVEGEDITLSYV